MNSPALKVEVRNTRHADIPGIVALSRGVYPEGAPWTEAQLASHLELFPEGQFVVVQPASSQVLGMAASLIVLWDDYDMQQDWRDFTAGGTFRNHDPEHGRTLYGAEIMVRPDRQGHGIGKKLYRARRELTVRLGLLRIRAGARLRGYHRWAAQMDAEEYVQRVINEEAGDPTLSFQLKEGFRVLGVVRNYLGHDAESLGYAAVIEWINQRVARPEDYAGQPPQFRKRLPAGAA